MLQNTYTAVTGYGYRDIPKWAKDKKTGKMRRVDPYFLNKVWDSDGNGYIDKGEMVKNDKFRSHHSENIMMTLPTML